MKGRARAQALRAAIVAPLMLAAASDNAAALDNDPYKPCNDAYIACLRNCKGLPGDFSNDLCREFCVDDRDKCYPKDGLSNRPLTLQPVKPPSGPLQLTPAPGGANSR